MRDTIMTIVQTILIPAIPIVVGMLAKLAKTKISESLEKMGNEKVKTYLEQATAAVEQAVTYTSQTYVDALKTSDLFDKEAQERAFGMAKGTAALLLSREAKDMLAQLYGDVDTWLDTKIEQTVRNTKIAA